MVAMAPAAPRVLTLLIDNYDSYTYNIYQMLAEVNGVAPVVVCNDAFSGRWADAWADFQWQAVAVEKRLGLGDGAVQATRDAPRRSSLALNVVISPGPGHPAIPSDFGMCAAAIRESPVPVFGVCLGHQGIAHVFGGEVVNAPEVMHGRTSRVMLDAFEKKQLNGLFAQIPDGFEVVRYHSLVVEPSSVPTQLQVTARTEDGVVMALQHRERPLYGVQFHPEAVCSEFGYQIFQNFRDITLQRDTSKCVLLHGDHMPNDHSSFLELASEQAEGQATSEDSPHYKVLIDRVASGIASLDFAQFVFNELFREAPRSFWLDSSNYANQEDHADISSVQGRQSSRFSYMGDSSGPMSHCVEYSVLQKCLRIEHCDGHREVIENADMLTHLRTSLRRLRSHTVLAINDQARDAPFSFRGGYVGFLGYEMLENGLEDARDVSASILCDSLQRKLDHDEYVPDASFLFADRAVVFDHQDQCVYTMSVAESQLSDEISSREWHATMSFRLCELATEFQGQLSTATTRQKSPTTSASPTDGVAQVVFHPSRSREQYLGDIESVQRQIHDGETYEVCLTNQLRARVEIGDPLAFYEELRYRNPAPYAAFYLSNPHGQFVNHSTQTLATTSEGHTMADTYAICCSSPERFLCVARDGWMESKPIKGTRRRGGDVTEDRAIIDELATCAKDRAENMMIADLVRNDFGRVAQIGSVHVPKLMRVESYATVHQLVTTVRAKQSARADLVDVLHATFPGGSMTGAPKKRTMQLIRQLERHARGVYSGALGFLSLDGSCDLNIIIRTAVITPRSVSLGSGGAIIALSDCDDEYDEMLLKTRALVQAVGAFVTGRDDGSGACVATTTVEQARARSAPSTDSVIS